MESYRQQYNQEIKTQYFETDDFNKYYYKLSITLGFIIGVIIDQVIPLTAGLPIKILKRFGRVFFSRDIKSKFMYKVLSVPFIGGYLRGFLE